jgi:hypothetical protein
MNARGFRRRVRTAHNEIRKSAGQKNNLWAKKLKRGDLNKENMNQRNDFPAFLLPY